MIAAPFRDSRFLPTNEASTERACAAIAGGAPSMTSLRTANIPVSRASPYRPPAIETAATPTSSVRPDGSSRSSAGGRRRGGDRTLPFMGATSPPRRGLLPHGGELERADELDFVLELDPELCPRAAPSLVHQCN